MNWVGEMGKGWWGRTGEVRREEGEEQVGVELPDLLPP